MAVARSLNEQRPTQSKDKTMPAPAQITLPSDREVSVTRQFNAPRQLVWDAHTKPELITKWMLGPSGWSMPVCEMDVRPGGKYRWRWKSNETGKEFGFFGVFREVNKTSRIVHEETYDPGDLGGAMPMDPAIITSDYVEFGGVTTLTVNMLFASKEVRDAAVSTGMTDGMEIGYARLDDMFQQPA
jgi:uncharacterized protein YndB with AHSA1/START domain